MRKLNFDSYSTEELLDITKKLNHWRWDERLGKKPLFFDELDRYKKRNDIKRRTGELIRAVWPFTKEDYIRPVYVELARRNVKGYETFRRHIYSEKRLQRLRRWLKSFLDQRRQA